MNHTFVALALLAFAAAGFAAASAPSASPAKAVIRHVVLFKFKDDAAPEKVRAIEEKFRTLKSSIPGIQDFEWGTNISPEKLDQGFTHCFFVTFPDTAARDAYLPHAAHLEFVALLKPSLDKVLVIDYETKN